MLGVLALPFAFDVVCTFRSFLACILLYFVIAAVLCKLFVLWGFAQPVCQVASTQWLLGPCSTVLCSGVQGFVMSVWHDNLPPPPLMV